MSKKQTIVQQVQLKLPKNIDDSKAMQLAFKRAVQNNGDSGTRNKQ